MIKGIMLCNVLAFIQIQNTKCYSHRIVLALQKTRKTQSIEHNPMLQKPLVHSD
ncbi:hypothetical protein HanIR_Chr08g0355171 [Helianthus annuus]|nr:hypothetical protein HanIR_Chr08g0355171 [Helianthus annuus]